MLEGEESAAPIIAGDTCFMPASYKPNLEKTRERVPKYYFIADISWPYPPKNTFALIREYAQNNSITNADVYLTAYNVQKTDLDSMYSEYGEGGFNMALAMGMIFKDVKNYPDSYPVILVATTNFYRAATTDNRKFTRDYPESEYYYLLNHNGQLTACSFADNIAGGLINRPMQSKVLAYEGFYFKDNELSEVSHKNTQGFSEVFYGADPFINALLLSEKIDKAATKAQIIETVRDSFSQRVLTGNNAFIVLETKEQEEELRRRNEDFLNGKEFGMPARASMDEPGILAAILCAAFFLLLLNIKRSKN
jgi:hypothetical protein